MLEILETITNNDPIEKRLKLLAALFEDCEPLTAEGFKKQLWIVQGFYKTPP